jgi:phage gp45-like
MNPIRRLLALCQLTLVDDTTPTQKVQADLGPSLPDGTHEIHDGAYVLNPYGLTSNPPLGSDALIVFLNAERSLGVITGVNFKSGRPTGLQPGEAAFFNAVTGKIFKMAADGKAHLNSDLVVDGAITAGSTITARVNGTPAELGAVRDAYVAHHHTGVQAGSAVSGTSDHVSGV